MKNENLFNEDHRATYCPEDNKLRLYVGRVPRPEYEALRSEGWTSTPKQNCQFVAHWTPARRDTAESYAQVIEDEDMTPEDRAADRAERFIGYREKRTDEATGHADRFDAGPAAHGFQSSARAERSAARHDRQAGKAVDAWSKAEYWQRRTAGVISHAQHAASPGVRMGRIKELEAEQRKMVAAQEQSAEELAFWSKPGLTLDEAKAIAGSMSSNRHMPRKEGDRPDFHQSPDYSTALNNSYPNLYAPRTLEEVITQAIKSCTYGAGQSDWLMHTNLRLAYEHQMLEAQGGRAAFVEIEAGGWWGSQQIRKVTKSPASGRVVSIEVMGTTRGFTKESGYKIETTRACPVLVNIERSSGDHYRAPTAEDLEALKATRKAEKAARPVVEACPLINPTEADALRLQELWNARAKAQRDAQANSCSADFVPAVVRRISQAVYSAASGGSYARAETKGVCALGIQEPRFSNMWRSTDAADNKRRGPALCKIRTTSGGAGWYTPDSVIVITDKPQKAIPAAVWEAVAFVEELALK